MLDTPLKLNTPKIGDRIECLGCIGTIKYIGEVDGHIGQWLGIDWDDSKRGKHNGTVKGVQYFTASTDSSGSFVRPEKIQLGQSIITAIEARYGKNNDEKTAKLEQQMLLCIQQGMNAPSLELVGFDKVSDQQSDFQNLELISVRSNNVNTIGKPLELKHFCPNIKELDISKNLINSWDNIFQLCTELEYLRSLNVSQNILSLPENFSEYKFTNLEELIVSSMRLTWNDILKLAMVFPNLTELTACDNEISNLNLPENYFSNLRKLYLSNNPIESWKEICNLGGLSKLENLCIESINLKRIWFDEEEKTDLFINLKLLWLKNNCISDWESIGELNKLRNLENLKISNNPINSLESTGNIRQFIIAKIGSLKWYNGTNICEERKGAEYDYLKKYGLEWLEAKKNPEIKKEFLKKHNRYLELIQKYGDLEESELKVQLKTIEVSLTQVELIYEDTVIKKKLPPTILIQKLIMLTQRLFKLSSRPRLIYVSKDHPSIEFDLDDECKELGIYSVQNGDKIFVKS